MVRNDVENYWLDDLKPPPWPSFVYVSDVIDEQAETQGPRDGLEKTLANRQFFPLATMQVGDRVRIIALNCGEANTRLLGMGFIPNAVLHVVSRTRTGSVIVALQDQRLGLSAVMAERIQVVLAAEPVDENQPGTAMAWTPMKTSPPGPTLTLEQAAIGSKLRVVGYDPTAREYKRKLLAMGLTPGTELFVTRHAPLGDPTEIQVRDFHLSLRKNEAKALIVELIPGGNPCPN